MFHFSSSATAYGAGCYFAVKASYSAQNDFCRPNNKGEKVMILARVITGDYCLGSPDYRAAPYKNDSEQYDSVVDNMSKPTKYVVFADSAPLAEYIIKFHLN